MLFADAGQGGEGAGEALADDGQGEVVLGVEVVVEAAVGHLGGLHQVGDADAVDAVGPEAPARGLDDLVVVELLLLLREAGHVRLLPGRASDQVQRRFNP